MKNVAFKKLNKLFYSIILGFTYALVSVVINKDNI